MRKCLGNISAAWAFHSIVAFLFCVVILSAGCTPTEYRLPELLIQNPDFKVKIGVKEVTKYNDGDMDRYDSHVVSLSVDSKTWKEVYIVKYNRWYRLGDWEVKIYNSRYLKFRHNPELVEAVPTKYEPDEAAEFFVKPESPKEEKKDVEGKQVKSVLLGILIGLLCISSFMIGSVVSPLHTGRKYLLIPLFRVMVTLFLALGMEKRDLFAEWEKR